MADALDKSGISVIPDGPGGDGSAAAATTTTKAEEESISACIRIVDESRLDDALRTVFAEVVSDEVSRP